MSIQTNLFGEIVENEVLHSITWSNSKIGFLETCPRKYYFHYYGSKKRNALSEPKKNELIFLSKLSNRYLFPGTVVHDIIRLFFINAKKGNAWDLNKLLWLAETKIKDAISYSSEKRENIIKEYKFEPTLLKEIYYQQIDEAEFKKELLDKVKKSITNFYNAEVFDELRQGGKQATSLIETAAEFEITPGIYVSGKIDIAYQNADQLFIVADWKTGNNDEDETSLQLLVYALWAVEEMKIPIENIRIRKAFLNSTTVDDLRYSQKELDRAKMRIIQSSESIKILDKYGVAANEEAFTPCFQPKVCALCPYEKICFKN
jgi:hypothetical protein